MHFESLPQPERDSILRIKGSKLPTVDANTAETSTPEPSDRVEIVTSESAKKQGKKKAEDVDDEVSLNSFICISTAQPRRWTDWYDTEQGHEEG